MIEIAVSKLSQIFDLIKRLLSIVVN